MCNLYIHVQAPPFSPPHSHSHSLSYQPRVILPSSRSSSSISTLIVDYTPPPIQPTTISLCLYPRLSRDFEHGGRKHTTSSRRNRIINPFLISSILARLALGHHSSEFEADKQRCAAEERCEEEGRALASTYHHKDQHQFLHLAHQRGRSGAGR